MCLVSCLLKFKWPLVAQNVQFALNKKLLLLETLEGKVPFVKPYLNPKDPFQSSVLANLSSISESVSSKLSSGHFVFTLAFIHFSQAYF